MLLTDAVLARIHITVRTTPGKVREVDRRAIETQLADAARRWEDDLRQALNEEEGEARAAPLYKRFGSAFPTAYEEAVSPRQAVADIRRLDALDAAPRAASRSTCTGRSKATQAMVDWDSSCIAEVRRSHCRTRCRCWRGWACA